MPLTAFTPLIPFLFFISTPPYSNEPPCSRGELIVCRPVVDKHGIMAGGYAGKSGRLIAKRVTGGGRPLRGPLFGGGRVLPARGRSRCSPHRCCAPPRP